MTRLNAHCKSICSRVALVAALFITLSVGAVGCRVSQGPLVTGAQSAKDVAVSRNQLRLRMRSLVQPMSGQIEQSADAIIADTTDPKVKMAALQWKIDAVPAIRAALFQPDPAVAALDTAVLCNQMIDYFEKGPGKQALGPASARAAATSRQMLDEFLRALAAGTYSGDISKGAKFAKKWAAEHPIRHSIADRESALAMSFERGESPGGITAGQAIADVTTTLDDLNRKFELYTDQLFRQARWEAERFTQERIAELRASPALPLAERGVTSIERLATTADHLVPAVDRALTSAERATTTLDRLAPDVERALTVAQNAPTLVTSEREAALKAVRDDITATTRFAHEERVATMQQVEKERILAVQALRETINQQREQLTTDVNRLSLVQINYIARLVTLLVAIAMAAAVVALLLGLFLARRLFAHR